MKKTLTLAALLLAMAGTAPAQEEKKVKVIEQSEYLGFSQLLGADRYEVDSIVVRYTTKPFGASAFAALLDCCENGRLTGIDLTHCMTITDNCIPAMAFCPATINAKPRKAEAGTGGDGEESGNPYRTNLRYISLPNYITEIGDYAFAQTNLESVEIPRRVQTIGNGAFDGCGSLKRVVLCGNRLRPGSDGLMFRDLPSDAVLVVTPGLGESYRSSDGWSAFGSVQESEDACRVLTANLDGGSTLEETFGEYAMRVDSVSLGGSLSADDIDFLRENIMYGRLLGLDLSEAVIDEGMLFYCKIESLRLPKHMSSIPECILEFAEVRSLSLPDTYERIGLGAFRDFKGEFADSTVVIPEGCRRICCEAFKNCKCIKVMMLPSTLEVLEPRSLGININYANIITPAQPHKSLDLYINRMYPPESSWTIDVDDDVKFNDNSPFWCLLDAVDADSNGCTVHGWRLFVPVGAKQNYESDEHWSHFMTIIETPLLTGDPTGIAAVTTASPSQAADGIYTIDGRIVSRSTSADSLPRGLYIVRENGSARKVVTGR